MYIKPWHNLSFFFSCYKYNWVENIAIVTPCDEMCVCSAPGGYTWCTKTSQRVEKRLHTCWQASGGFCTGTCKKKKKKEKESNHDSLCCVVFLILYIQIDFLIWYVLWIWMCARSTSESPEAQRDGTLWRGFTPTQNVTLSMLLKHFLMANYNYY